MKRFLVMSGEMTRIVEAEDHEKACSVAVLQEHNSDEPAELAIVCEVIEVCEDDTSFVATEVACRAAGCWRDAAIPS